MDVRKNTAIVFARASQVGLLFAEVRILSGPGPEQARLGGKGVQGLELARLFSG